MFYRLLGMAVWKGGKLFLRRKYGPTFVPKPLLAGAALTLVGGAVLLAVRRGMSQS
jgi:hypothetical protein